LYCFSGGLVAGTLFAGLNVVRGVLEGGAWRAAAWIDRSDRSELRRIVELPDIITDYTPATVPKKELEELLGEKEKAALEQLDAEYRKGVERVKKQVEERRRELVIAAIDTIKERLDPIVKALLTQRSLEESQQRLYELRNLCIDVGLRAMAESVIKPLEKIATAISFEDAERLSQEIFNTKNVVEGVDHSIESLLKHV